MLTGALRSSRSLAGWVISHSPHLAPIERKSLDHPEFRTLVESIICNIDRLGLDTAIVLSGVNTLRNPELAMKARDIGRFVPNQEHQLPALLEALSNITCATHAVHDTRPVLTAIHRGREIVRIFAEDEKDIGRERARIIYAEHLKILWTEVCASMLKLISETNAELRLVLPLAYQQNSAVLTSLISGAMNGLSPCLNEQGQLYAPSLPQQRKWVRHTILQNCHVAYNGDTFEAFVKDASAGGLGLEKMPELSRNSQIKVILESGRTFDCTVAWSNGSSAGVKFPAPLSQSDPLLTG